MKQVSKMKIRIVSSRNEIENLNPDEMMIHLRFRPRNMDLLNLMQRCPRLRAVQISFAHHKALSNTMQAFMNMNCIELLAGKAQGHRKNLEDYLIVDDTTEKKILALAKEGIPEEEIANEIKEVVNLSPDLIRYIIKSKRTACRTRT
jgi:hypothetical protein